MPWLYRFGGRPCGNGRFALPQVLTLSRSQTRIRASFRGFGKLGRCVYFAAADLLQLSNLAISESPISGDTAGEATSGASRYPWSRSLVFTLEELYTLSPRFST